jgi:hypothetical protein
MNKEQEEKFNQLCEEKPQLDFLQNEMIMCTEREIVKLLLQYGEIDNFVHNGIRMSVADFIIRELGRIFKFYDPINNRILSIYKMAVYMGGEIPSPIHIKDYFRDDKLLTERIDELLITPYKRPDWGIIGVVIGKNEEEEMKRLNTLISSAIIRFKDSRIEHCISEYEHKIENHQVCESDIIIYTAEIEAMKKVRQHYNKQLGIMVAQ